MSTGHYQIWLFRHGATEWSTSGRHTGRTDLPLNFEGRQGASEVGRRMNGRPFALVLSSPLVRALDTCRLAGYGDNAEQTDDLMEWDYGDYEGRRTVDIREENPGWLLWTGGVPNGETAEQVGERVDRVIARTEEAGGDVALFAHGHVLRVLTARWLGLPPIDGKMFALDTASVSVLGFEHDYHVIRRWNQRSDLVEVDD
ncbi:MAG: histidine phosphatase family protein [Pseudomonadota bacterium]